MAAIAGIFYIRFEGELLQTARGSMLSLGGYKYTKKVGHAVYGDVAEVIPSEGSFKVMLTQDTPIEALRTMREQSILFEADIGLSWNVPKCSISESLSFTEGDGEMEVKFSGNPGEQL